MICFSDRLSTTCSPWCTHCFSWSWSTSACCKWSVSCYSLSHWPIWYATVWMGRFSLPDTSVVVVGSPQIAYSPETAVRYHHGSGPRHASAVMSPTISLPPNTQHQIHVSGAFPAMLSHHQHPGSFGDPSSPTFVLGPPPFAHGIRPPHQTTTAAAGLQFVR